MRRRWPLTLRGTGAVALAAISFAVAQRAGIPELMYFGVLMAALVVCAVLVLIGGRGGRVTRTVVPDVVEAGATATVTVGVELPLTLPTAPARWRDALPDGLTGHAEGALPAPTAGARGERRAIELAYEVVGAARGIHSLGRLEITTTDPFGLARRRFTIGRPTPVTVAPALADLAPLPSAAGEAGGTRQSAALHLGQGADNLVARPYAPGDSMRRIHWRATAHRDTLMVRQEEQESSPAATVVLDRGLSRWSAVAADAPGRDPAFETAVSACVSVVARLVHEGYTVDVVDSDGDLLAEPVEGGEDAEARALAASFASLCARPDHPSRRVLPASAAAMLGPVVVVTGALTRDDAAGIGSLAQRSALPILLAVAEHPDLDGPRRAGWRTAAVRPGGDVAEAWETACERGRADVGR